MGLSEYEAHELQTLFFDMDRASVKELASVWKPGVPFSQNPEYLQRAKELNRDLEAALLSRFTQEPPSEKRD
jgi:CPA2 family monovalent cation:H+ antiporter-2